MRLIFIRHGEPDYEHDSLTEKGWREAKLLAARTKDWHVDDFYVSPLGRARDTASFTLKAHGKTAEIMDWLHEFLGKVPDGAGGTRLCWDLMPADWTAQPELLQPGEICEFRIDLWSIANCFLPGHRIRLEVAGSDFPEFSRNSQTGGSIADDVELRVARQTVFHDGDRRSCLILPVLERGLLRQ